MSRELTKAEIKIINDTIDDCCRPRKAPEQPSEWPFYLAMVPMVAMMIAVIYFTFT